MEVRNEKLQQSIIPDHPYKGLDLGINNVVMSIGSN